MFPPHAQGEAPDLYPDQDRVVHEEEDMMNMNTVVEKMTESVLKYIVLLG